jgi:hypothetical protein
MFWFERRDKEGTIICSIQGHFEDTTAISLQPTVFRDWKTGRKEEDSHGTLRMLFWKTPQSLISACVFLLRREEKERREQTFLVRGVHFRIGCSYLLDMMALFVGRREESETYPALQTTILEARVGKVIEYGVVLLDFRIRSVG